MADVFHGFSGSGKVRRSLPASAAITALEIGDSIIYSGGDVTRKAATGAGIFAGFSTKSGAVAADAPVEFEIADRIVVKHSSAAAADAGQFLNAGTGPQTFSHTAHVDNGDSPATPANSARIGLIVDVEVGKSWTVDTRIR